MDAQNKRHDFYTANVKIHLKRQLQNIKKIALCGEDKLSTTNLIQKRYLELQQVEGDVQVNCVILTLH